MAGALFTTTTAAAAAKWWVIGLLWIVYCINAAPLAVEENVLLRTTTTESVMMTTEELDFKDVPIYPKEKPGAAAAAAAPAVAVAVSSPPPPVKYIQVLKCDSDKKVITVDNTLGVSVQTAAETTKEIPSDATAVHVPEKNKEAEQSANSETAITVKTEEKNPPQDSSVSAVTAEVDDHHAIKTDSAAIDAEVNNNKKDQVVKIVETVKAAVAEAADVHEQQQQQQNAAQAEVKPLEKIKEPETEIAIASLTAENGPSAVASAATPDEVKQDQPQTVPISVVQPSVDMAAVDHQLTGAVGDIAHKPINNDRAPVKEVNDVEKFTPLDAELTGLVEVEQMMPVQTQSEVALQQEEQKPDVSDDSKKETDDLVQETVVDDAKKDKDGGQTGSSTKEVSNDGAPPSSAAAASVDTNESPSIPLTNDVDEKVSNDVDSKSPSAADNGIRISLPAAQQSVAEESNIKPVLVLTQDADPSAMANEDDENNKKTAADNESEVDNNKNEEFESGSEMMPAESDPVKDFTGYKVYRVTIPTEEAAAWILKFEDLPGVEFWADPKLLLRPRGFFVTSAADLLVAPDVTEAVEEAFHQARLPFEILIKDLQDAIKNENPLALLSVEELVNKDGHSLTWDRYGTLDDIYSYFDFLKVTFPSFVSVTEIGKSTEGRAIYAVRLSQKGGRANKKAIFIDSGIHAREWITHATSTYMMKEIVDNPVKYECLMNEFDFIFVPVINPDGYVYSHSKNRMWRKTRSQSDNIVFRKAAEESLKAERLARFDEDPILDDSILEQLRSKVINNKASFSCTGTDANRNFDFKWLTGGSSKNPCTDTYAGSKAFSEPETQALSNYILANKDQIEMYISLHAYSQFWLLPWGYTETKPEDYSDLYSLAKIGSQALEKVNGVNYMIGTIPDLLYVASGSSIDWVKAVAGVKYAYTLELRDVGRYGFILPADKIIPSGIETWAGIYASALELASRVYSDSAQCPAI